MTWNLFPLVIIAVVLFVILNLAAGLIWVERRLLALWQDRYGPNRVGPFGLGQVIADSVKMFTKEDWVPPFADKPVFVLAPAIIVATALLSFAVVPFSPGFVIADLDIEDLLDGMMQATAQNRSVAVIIGIDVERMILLTFVINAVLCAIASILISPIYLAKFTNGETLGMAAFIAAIIGGFNQVRGAILGGLILGVLDNLSAAYISSQYRGAFPLIILIAVILLRPQGLLGRLEERTV